MVIIGLCTMELFLGEAASLKDKRRILKSLLDQIKARYNVSAAEVDQLDLWQRSTIAFVCVGNDRSRLDQLLSAVVRSIEKRGLAQVNGYRTEII